MIETAWFSPRAEWMFEGDPTSYQKLLVWVMTYIPGFRWFSEWAWKNEAIWVVGKPCRRPEGMR